MFNFKVKRCKTILQKSISKCFDPLRDELGTVPTELQSSKYVTASMLGICDAYANKLGITLEKKHAIISDAIFEEIFRRDATKVLTQTDYWKDNNDSEFNKAFEQAKESINTSNNLEIKWLEDYLINNFKPSTTLML